MFKLFSPLNRQRTMIAGLDISSSNIHLVEFSSQPHLQLERYASAHLPAGVITDDGIDDLERLIDTVRTLRETSGAQSRRIVISLPTAMTVMGLRPLQTATEEEDQLEALARAHAAEILPYPLTQASIDFCALAPAHPGDLPSLFVAAVRQEIMDDLLAMVEVLALEAIAVDIACYADYAGWMHAQAAVPATSRPNRIAMLRIEDAAVHCSLFVNDHLRGDKTSCRLLVVPKGTIATPLPQAVADLLRTVLTQTGTSQLDQIVVSGSNACVIDLGAMLLRQFRTNAILAAPFAGIKLADGINPKHLESQAPTYLTASGAALRNINKNGAAI